MNEIMIIIKVVGGRWLGQVLGARFDPLGFRTPNASSCSSS